MPSREPAPLSARRRFARELGDATIELRDRRIQVGLSQTTVARAAGLSRAELSRLEREALESPNVVDLAAVAAALGMRLRLGLYPEGEPVHDRVQLALLGAFRRRLHPSMAWRNEVPLPIGGDRRAWDAVTTDEDGVMTGIEGMSRLGAVDATLRRANQKLRDDPRISRLVLVVADTARNRYALRASVALVRADFPLDTREVLAALAAGRAPALNGVVLVRVPRDTNESQTAKGTAAEEVSAGDEGRPSTGRPHRWELGGWPGPWPQRFVENPVGAPFIAP